MNYLTLNAGKEALDQRASDMSKLILSVNEDEMSLFKKQYLSLPELCDEIEDRLTNKPDGRKRKDVAKWKEETNFLIDMYNAKAKFKTYKRIK